MLLGLASILFLIAATGFFVAGEFALVNVRKTRVEQLISEGSSVARGVKYGIEHLEQYIAATQIGITLATVGLGALGEPVLAQLFLPFLEEVLPPVEAFVSAHGVAIALSFLIVTVLEIILGEIVPKIIARQRSEATALLLIRPLNFFVLIFRPLIWLVSLLSNAVVRLLGLPPGMEHASVHSVEELELLVSSSRQAGLLDREEEVILRRVFDFGDLVARQVMRPRTELIALSADATLSDVMQTMNEHKYSRFPVYEGDLDNIIGIVHVKDVFMFLSQSAGVRGSADGADGNRSAVGLPPLAVLDGQFRLTALMHPREAVPETLNVADLLSRMQQSRLQMMVVIDEYGGTAGIVTLEDIVEEIVGEVRDEFESGETASGITVTPEGTVVDGLVPIEDVNEALGLQIESESDTLGGYVFDVLGRKPELGDEVSNDGFVLRVTALDNLRIAKVLVLQNSSAQDGPSQETGDDE